jgi:fucose permease
MRFLKQEALHMAGTSRTQVSIVALTAVFGLGIAFIILGAVSEELKTALGATNADIGNLVLTLFLTSVFVQLIVGPLVDKFGYKPVAIVGFLVGCLSLFLIGSASSLGTATVACVLLGVGAMCMNTVGNTLIPVVLFDGKDPARASNFGNAFFGLGYVVTPLLFSLLGSAGMSYRTGVFILGALMIVFLLVALSASFPAVSTGYEFSMAFKLLGTPAVLIAALALFCYISLEVSMGTWSKPYMTELFGGAANPGAVAKAGLILSLFGAAMMVGRFLTSMVKNLTAIGVRLIAGLALVAVATILTMVWTSSPGLAIAAVMLTGFVFAPIFPTIVGVTFAKFEPRLYGSIFGIIFAIGLLGGTFVPQFVGQLSVGATIQQSLLIVAAMGAALFVIALFLGVGSRPAGKA